MAGCKGIVDEHAEGEGCGLDREEARRISCRDSSLREPHAVVRILSSAKPQ